MSSSKTCTSIFSTWLTCLLLALAISPARAQIDPAPRKILHLGVDSSLHNQGPMGAYAFYYWNLPNVPSTNVFLRLAIAPVYVDSEMGFKGLLGKNTDVGVGAFGGLYANSYQEVDAGNWKKDESFDGDGGGGSLSVYHLFNPDQRIPLSGVLRASVNYVVFDKTSDTAGNFALPQNQPIITYRAGFRWGGKEPYLAPTLGLGISAWYELEQRTDSGSYGYSANPYRLESVSQRVFARAQVNYTTLKWKHYIVAGLMGGASFNPDRFSCYRLGGMLPYTKEFPLMIPGYYYEEISAQDYGLFYGDYSIPFGPNRQWSWVNLGAVSVVKYLQGTGQAGSVNSGVGSGIEYEPSSRRWKIFTVFGYGFQAERSHGRGGYSLGVAFQYNFGSTQYASQRAYEEMENAHNVTR